MTQELAHTLLQMPEKLESFVKRIALLGDAATVNYHPEAARWLALRRVAVTPGERGQCREWLKELVKGINNVTKEQVTAREAAIWSMCNDVPAAAWCPDTVHAVWAKTPFLPGPGEVREVLEAYVAPLRAQISALEKIVDAPREDVIGAPAREPYPVQPIPPWCYDRGIQKRGTLADRVHDTDFDDCPQGRMG